MPNTENLRSLFSGNVYAEVDPWSENGVAAEFRAAWPAEFAIASRVHAQDDPQLPRMFAGGKQNLPTSLASGIDPKMLAQVPYRVRHAIAAEPSQSKAYAMLEQYADDPFAEIDHKGLRDAVARISEWSNVPADQLTEGEQAALYERVMAPVRDQVERRITYASAQAQYVSR